MFRSVYEYHRCSINLYSSIPIIHFTVFLAYFNFDYFFKSLKKYLIELFNYDEITEHNITNSGQSLEELSTYNTPKKAFQKLLKDFRADTPDNIKNIFLESVKFQRHNRRNISFGSVNSYYFFQKPNNTHITI